jgi:uncharacterized membrane protein YsdA (DUF1294 family)
MEGLFFSLPAIYQVLVLYGVAVNLVTFAYFGIDKSRAQRQVQRTPENILWFLSLIGGTIGALGAMHLFRHKTKKVSFQLVLAVIGLVQICIVVLIFHYGNNMIH